MHWFLFLAIHNIIRHLLPHQSSKVSILFLACFFKVQPLLPYRIIGNTMACMILIFVDIDRSKHLNTFSSLWRILCKVLLCGIFLDCSFTLMVDLKKQKLFTTLISSLQIVRLTDLSIWLGLFTFYCSLIFHCSPWLFITRACKSFAFWLLEQYYQLGFGSWCFFIQFSTLIFFLSSFP